MTAPFLSIVIPTREGLDPHWQSALWQVEGDVEFILVHPPGIEALDASDRRLRQIHSPFRGEIVQRLTGLTNARGRYILSMNCDEYVMPTIVAVADRYFSHFPSSWVLALKAASYPYGSAAELRDNPWPDASLFDPLKVCPIKGGDRNLFHAQQYLLEIPIAPLSNPLDLACLIRDRTDRNGWHSENFDKRIWRSDVVRVGLKEIERSVNLLGPLKYLPFWSLDRVLGLTVQAALYESACNELGGIIGHRLPLPEQLRTEDNPPDFPRTQRYQILCHLMLVRLFPRCGYFWNIVLDEVKDIPRVTLRENPRLAPWLEKLKAFKRRSREA